MAAAILMLMAGAVAWGVSNEQEELGNKAEAALAAAGIAIDDVTFRGRDAVLSDTGLSAEERARAVEVVSGLTGVRTVRFRGESAAEPVPTTLAPTSPTSTATTTTTTTATTTTTTTTTTTAGTTPPATTVPASTASRLVARLESGALHLEGTLPDAEAAARLEAVVDLIYGPFVTNDLVVDPAAEPASWVPGAARTISVLPILGTASLEVTGEQSILTGLAATEEKRARIGGALQSALGPAVTLENRVEVTGKQPPLYTAAAASDGTLVLGGVMPDQAAIDRIVEAAVDVYGADSVINQMAIGDNVDTTFSLFRIPLTFAQFAPIPQWELRVDDDVITGVVREGATFAFGSAELTPELRTLLNTAAGILLRNPTLGINVEGHTDSIGPEGFNQQLSIARAEAAVVYLAELGLDPARLSAAGFGETRPIASNQTAEGRARNRRVEFLLGPVEGAG